MKLKVSYKPLEITLIKRNKKPVIRLPLIINYVAALSAILKVAVSEWKYEAPVTPARPSNSTAKTISLDFM
ncbi:hypothetical protein [Bacillus atrophaeus]|uniref:hypothetical protein n=1 Tax=Bacillus atrophaeus TaxID=1452 RepID=UPI002E2128D4|nr:hypothetical protein [Bacillus atrophaeus]